MVRKAKEIGLGETKRLTMEGLSEYVDLIRLPYDPNDSEIEKMEDRELIAKKATNLGGDYVVIANESGMIPMPNWFAWIYKKRSH